MTWIRDLELQAIYEPPAWSDRYHVNSTDAQRELLYHYDASPRALAKLARVGNTPEIRQKALERLARKLEK